MTAAACSAAAAAATARGGGRSRRASPAADGDGGQQLYGVVVPLRTGGRSRRLAHRPGLLEGVTAGTTAVLISGHEQILPGAPDAVDRLISRADWRRLAGPAVGDRGRRGGWHQILVVVLLAAQ
jgi:hypothetical protein